MADPHPKISAIVLAGGQAKRMNGADKGLQLLHGKPLIAWVLERIAPQVDEILVSANRNQATYAAFGHTVLADDMPDFKGPLAGLRQGMAAARYPLVLCVPCDTPLLPCDLAERLLAALEDNRAQVAVAATQKHSHRTVCLCRRDLSDHLAAFLAQGGRKVGDWQASLKSVVVFFQEAEHFRNFNTLEDLAGYGKECRDGGNKKA
jgi:molybdenum cofactor guanylyltransferase